MTTEPEGMCREVDERICDVIDGVADNALLDHLAHCERCRDARYDAEQVLVRVADAALDYRLPVDLAVRLERGLDAGRASRTSLIPAAIGAKLASLESLLGPGEAGVARPSAQPPPGPSKPRRAEGRLESARWAWLCLAAAAGLGALWLGNRHEPGQAPPRVQPGPVGGWQGRVEQIERAFGSPSGLSECARGTQVCHPLAPGDAAHAGMRLQTDGLTRALVKFADGSRLALDRQTRFELDPSAARRGRLLEGNLVAEIEPAGDAAPLDGTDAEATRGPPSALASIDLALGRVEVLGTKFSLRAADDSARVEVSRGSVKLYDARGQAVVVQAGEAAVLGKDRTPRVESVLELGQALGWSTSAFEAKPEPGQHGALGELIAKRPKDGRELAGAVTLTQHHITARIVDTVARTEIEEVFENQADEVLEGIYRFPLPPGAQIERLALEVDGKLEEGAFVDRERAAAIWRGAVVNAGGQKPAANQDIVWVPGPWRDPALLEWQRGSRFELRIFPIPARGTRRVVLAYTELLAPSEGERTYVYPLPRDPRGSTRIASFTAEVQVRGHDLERGVQARGYPLKLLSGSPEVARLAYDQKDFVPSGDLSVAYELAHPEAELRTWVYQPTPAERRAGDSKAGDSRAGDLKAGDLKAGDSKVGGSKLAETAAPTAGATATLAGVASGLLDERGLAPDAPFVAMAIKPTLPRRARYEPRDYVIVADTSRSMIGESYRRAISVVSHIIEELDRSDRVTLLACDASCVELAGGYLQPGDASAEAAARFLEAIEPEGASDLGFAVEQAAAPRARELAANTGAPAAAPRPLRVIYVGDGTPTVGPIHPALLERAVAEALPAGASFSAVAVGTDADRGALRAATRAGGGVSVAFTPGQSAQDVAYAVLGATYGRALQNARLELPEGLVQVVPERLGSIAAGAEELVVARLTRPRVQGDVILRGEVGGEAFERRFSVELAATPGEANAFVPRLYAGAAIAELEASMDERARRRSIELSTEYNVASRYTSLLVLESPAMFTAFGLDGRSRAPDWSGELESQKAESSGDDDPSSSLESRAPDALGAVGPSSGAALERGSRRAPGARAAPRAQALSADRAASDPIRPRSDEAALGAPEADRAPEAPEADRALDADRALLPSRRLPDDPYAEQNPYERDRAEKDRPAEGQPEPRRQPLELPERRMIPMRRVWERTARIDAPASPLVLASPERRQRLELDVNENAESRDALRNLYVVNFLGDDLEGAERVAEHWSDKDPLDVDALTARADLAAQRGQRELAIRILGSVVDVRPGDYKAQWRLARLHRWAGHPERGCRHSLAVAQLMLRDAKLVSEAIGCSREVGQSAIADELLGALEPSLRREVEQLVARRRTNDELSGDFRVQASWQGSEHDLDVVILNPEGYRVSWLGAPTRAVITANDVLSVHREGLALRGAPPGQYAIEVTRSSAGPGVVRGSLQLGVANAERSVPFVLEQQRVRVASVTLRNEPRLVPLEDGQ